MDLNETKRAGGMPPENRPPEPGFRENPPPYATIPQNDPPTAPMSMPMGTMNVPAPTIANASSTTYIPVVMQQQMGPNPASMVCHSCNQQMTTRVETKAAMKTHLFALILCLLGCWPCACIPYCTDSCMSTEHYCPNCNAYIGVYSN